MKLLLLSIMLSSFQLLAQIPTGRSVMEKVDQRPDGEDRKMSMEMVLINKRGRQRVRKMLMYSKDYGKDSKSIFSFLTPADVKGVGFLTWSYDDPSRDDDRWLYLPALKRSKRISGKSKNDYFMGSDLTYDDMGDRALDDDKHKLLREESEHWVVESVPVASDDMYSKTVSWIRKESLIASKIDFYDRQGLLLKTLKKTELVKKQGYWIALKTEVHNIQDNHKTIINLKDIKYDQGLRNSLFRVSTLEQERLR